MDILVNVAIFAAFVVGIGIAFRLFMRGDTAAERVAALLPADFRPDLSYRKGDTYIGYEKAGNRLVLVDWPHAKVLAPQDVRALDPVRESVLGITHHWLAVEVPDPKFSKYRIWFQFRPARLREWQGRMAELCGK